MKRRIVLVLVGLVFLLPAIFYKATQKPLQIPAPKTGQIVAEEPLFLRVIWNSGDPSLDPVYNFSFDKLCEARDLFWLSRGEVEAFSKLPQQPIEGIERGGLQKLNQKFGQEYSRLLIRLLFDPPSVNACEGAGGRIDLNDKWAVSREIFLLNRLGFEVERFGYTGPEIRSLLISGLRLKVRQYRAGNRSGAVEALREAMSVFGITARDLWLSDTETRQIIAADSSVP
ncbi:MAG: hypothetical protein AAB871_00445 [Patescibacteria group bacterium]